MTNFIDPGYFRELAAQRPEDVCRRAICHYDDIKKSYNIVVWGDVCVVSPHERSISRIGKQDFTHHEYLKLVVLYYLARSKEAGLSDTWISEKDIPGGTAFFRGPHELPTHLIVTRFTGGVNQFRKGCENLRGLPLDMADAGYMFTIFPRIPVSVLYWAGDDEFPPEAKLLFDRSIIEHLALDIIFALAVGVCHAVANQAGAVL